MMVNRLLDVLTGKLPTPKGFMQIPSSPELKAEVTERIRMAEKFDFGNLMLESGYDEVHEMPYSTVPQLTDEEDKFFEEGLVPLPAPFCWYEFTLDGHQSGMIVTHDWWVMRFDFDRHQGRGTADWSWVRRIDKERNGFEIKGNTQFLKSQYSTEDAKRLGSMHHGGNWSLARYFTLMINSRTTKTEYVSGHPPAHSAQLNPKKNDPRYEHRIITIIPHQYYVDARKEGESLRQPPRLHWRRSHLRTLKSGKKIVIARMLVGRSELGAISHEYKVPL